MHKNTNTRVFCLNPRPRPTSQPKNWLFQIPRLPLIWLPWVSFWRTGKMSKKCSIFFKALLWPNWLIFFKYSQLIFKGATKILKASLSPYLNLFQSRGVPVWGPEHNSNTGGCQSKQILGCPIKNHPMTLYVKAITLVNVFKLQVRFAQGNISLKVRKASQISSILETSPSP